MEFVAYLTNIMTTELVLIVLQFMDHSAKPAQEPLLAIHADSVKMQTTSVLNNVN